MPLEGLRAWIGEVERKLRARTRVMLALAAVAIGLAGAALYLAIDAHDTAVSEGDVRALQRQLEERIDQVRTEASGGAGAATRLESEVQALKGEVEALKEGAGKGKKGASSKGASMEGSTGQGSEAEAPPGKGVEMNKPKPGDEATTGTTKNGQTSATGSQPSSGSSTGK
ncbi:MAG TPA: hypothetical protein VFP23_02820 [Solirubrobacterales bacterium]|nr:hypothetical protein [Solirubrobacterales bacterium]